MTVILTLECLEEGECIGCPQQLACLILWFSFIEWWDICEKFYGDELPGFGD